MILKTRFFHFHPTNKKLSAGPWPDKVLRVQEASIGGKILGGRDILKCIKAMIIFHVLRDEKFQGFCPSLATSLGTGYG